MRRSSSSVSNAWIHVPHQEPKVLLLCACAAAAAVKKAGFNVSRGSVGSSHPGFRFADTLAPGIQGCWCIGSLDPFL